MHAPFTEFPAAIKKKEHNRKGYSFRQSRKMMRELGLLQPNHVPQLYSHARIQAPYYAYPAGAAGIPVATTEKHSFSHMRTGGAAENVLPRTGVLARSA